MIKWLHKTQLYKVKPVDSTACKIIKCELNHNRVDLLKVLPATPPPPKKKKKKKKKGGQFAGIWKEKIGRPI